MAPSALLELEPTLQSILGWVRLDRCKNYNGLYTYSHALVQVRVSFSSLIN